MHRPDFALIEKTLNIVIPESVISFVLHQTEFTIQCGNIVWDLWNQTESIIEYSRSLSLELKLNILILADNGIGDHLLLLPSNENSTSQIMKKNIYVLEHESATVKRYAASFEQALTYTSDDDFIYKKSFVYKLEDNELVKGTDD